MKILHIIIGLGNGGAENTLLKICSPNYSKYNHEVISLTKNKEILSKFQKKKIKVNYLNFKKKNLNIFQIFLLLKLIKSIRPSIIFCWMYHACFISILINLFNKKKFNFVWLIRHGSFHPKFTKLSTYMIRYILKIFIKIPKAVLYCSNFSMRIHKEYGFNSTYSKVINNGVAVNKFRFNLNNKKKIRKYLNIESGYFVVGMVGRNHPQKNYKQLFRILKDDYLSKEKIAIVFIGKNVNKLKPFIVKNKNHKFIFMKERKDIQRFYSAFDLNLSTSTFGESFPNVLIEGMSCCIPTLASKISDNHKILNDKNMIFEANNDVELVKKIKGILKKYNNQKYKQQNYNLRKRVIDNFSLNLMCKNYHLFLKDFV